MLPITSSSEVFYFPPSGVPRAKKWTTRYRQAKPYNLPLPYATAFRSYTKGTGNADWAWQPSIGHAVTIQDFELIPTGNSVETQLRGAVADATNSALKKFDKARGEASALLVAAVEIRKSAQMIEGRLTQLYRGFKALKSLRFYDAAKAFNLVRDRKPKSRRVGKNRKLRWVKHPIAGKYYPRPVDASLTRASAQSVSALILEYNFGWGPLVGDIQTSVKAIEQDIAYEYPLQGFGGRDLSVWSYPYNPSYPHTCLDSVKVRCRVGATWSVTNPNYELSRRLGLVDLATAAIEVIPFSFVLNWMINLNEWVGQLSTRYDPNLKDWHYGVKIESVASRSVIDNWFPHKPPEVTTSFARSFMRKTGVIPGVSLRVRQKWFTSFTRAANASSLLVTLFSTKERPSFLRI